MGSDQILDQIEHKKNSKFTVLALTGLIATIIFLIILFALYFIDPDGSNEKTIPRITTFLLVISNLCGFVFTLLSYIYNEEDTIFRTIATVGNLILLLIIIVVASYIMIDIFIQ